MSLMLAAPSAIAAASETSTVPRSKRGELPFFRSAPLSRGQSGLVGGLAEQDRSGVADQACSVGGDLQGMVPPVMLHGEERSRSVDYMVVVTRNLPGPGRSSLFNPVRDGRFAAVPPHSRDALIGPHP